MNTKTYTVTSNGNVPPYLLDLITKFDGKPVTKDLFFVLDQDIEFYVVECRECHGNTTKADKSGWLYSKEQGGNLWNINFNVK